MLSSRKLRIVVRKSIRHMLVQIVEYQPSGDRIMLTAKSGQLRKLGWTLGTGNIPAAYLTGYLAGKKALQNGISEAILDIGMQGAGDRVYAALNGAVDAGLKVPFNKSVLPRQERIKGAHISSYADVLAKDSARYSRQFKVPVTKIAEQFRTVKESIDHGK